MSTHLELVNGPFCSTSLGHVQPPHPSWAGAPWLLHPLLQKWHWPLADMTLTPLPLMPMEILESASLQHSQFWQSVWPSSYLMFTLLPRVQCYNSIKINTWWHNLSDIMINDILHKDMANYQKFMIQKLLAVVIWVESGLVESSGMGDPGADPGFWSRVEKLGQMQMGGGQLHRCLLLSGLILTKTFRSVGPNAMISDLNQDLLDSNSKEHLYLHWTQNEEWAKFPDFQKKAPVNNASPSKVDVMSWCNLTLCRVLIPWLIWLKKQVRPDWILTFLLRDHKHKTHDIYLNERC